MEEQDFSTQAIFTYNYPKKLRFAVITIVTVSLVTLLLASYFLFLKNQDFALVHLIQNIGAHFNYHFSNATTLGVLYASLIGGLFFVLLPLEGLFIAFLRAGANPYVATILYVAGFLISFTLNYHMGGRLNVFTKKVTGSKKFYKTKGFLNKHGTLGVFLLNIIPFAPSQPLSALLGIFNYNKTKFYVYFVSGQLIKYLAISILYIYILT